MSGDHYPTENEQRNAALRRGETVIVNKLRDWDLIFRMERKRQRGEVVLIAESRQQLFYASGN